MADGDIVLRTSESLHALLLDAQVTTTNGVWVDAAPYAAGFVTIVGITTGTIEIRGSNAATRPANASHEALMATALTADGFVSIPALPKWIKARVTVGTTITATAGLYATAR